MLVEQVFAKLFLRTTLPFASENNDLKNLLIVPGKANWRIGTIKKKTAILRQVSE